MARHPRHNYCLAATLYLRARPAMCSSQPGVPTPPQPFRDNHGAWSLGPTNPPSRGPGSGSARAAADRSRHAAQPQVVLRRQPQSPERRRLGAADDDPRAAHRHRDRRRQHAPQGWRGPGDALSQGGRVGLRLAGRARITAVDTEAVRRVNEDVHAHFVSLEVAITIDPPDALAV